MRIVSTVGEGLVAYAPDHTETYIDVSLESPDQQFEALTEILEADDARHPAPFTGTPPYGEVTPEAEYIDSDLLDEEYLPFADLETQAETDLDAVISDAPRPEIPEWLWYNDDQYHGLGVPPGAPNVQPLETGHTQIILENPADAHGWDEWSGKFVAARVARHENNFPAYNAGTSRGHGVVPIKLYGTYYSFTQQQRDLLLAEIQKRGLHNVVIADVPAQPYTEQVQVVDPTVLEPQGHIGPEGVLP